MSTITIGVISDTHGLLRPEAIRALADSDLIIHAGDVGRPEILEELGRVAPVHAVRGNVDKGPWADALPAVDLVEAAGTKLLVLHDLNELDAPPDGCDAVISGHTHRPSIERRDGVLYLNPGSAGPRRFDLPISLARIELRDGRLDARLIELEVE